MGACLTGVPVFPAGGTVHPHMHPCSATDPATAGVKDDIWGFFMVAAAMVCQYHPHGLLRLEFERSVSAAELSHNLPGAGHAYVCTAYAQSRYTRRY